MLMVSTMKKSLQKKAEKFLYVSTLSIIGILLIYNIFRYIYVFQNIENLNSKFVNSCSLFIFSPRLLTSINNYDIYSSIKDLYVFPELKNILCLGKLGEISYINSNTISTVIYTNSKFINQLVLLFNFLLIFFHYFYDFLKFKKLVFLLISFNVFTLIFYFNSLDVVTYSLVISSAVLIYLFENEY